jgi:hypothetical protein
LPAAPFENAAVRVVAAHLAGAAGFGADVDGFRTSFRKWVQEQTHFPREVAEAALAHMGKDKAQAAYARSDVFERRRKMMERRAGYPEMQREGGPKVTNLR